MKISVILCCAGKGTRTGFEKNKLLVPLLGITPIERAITNFCLPEVGEILLSANADDFAELSPIVQKYPLVRLVQGGNTRGESVFNALKECKGEMVLVHDGARPFVSPSTVRRCKESVEKHGSGICAIPTTDTIAVTDGETVSYPNRANAYAVQTPQGFYTKELLRAYAQAEKEGLSFTDDSSLFARYIRPPRFCEGEVENKKLTYASDFQPHASRVGFGVDTHAFGKAQNYIVLAGVQIPSASGLIAHSDGDVLVHALMDALLSGAGLYDIGRYFPDTDEKWKNASSMKMLERVVSLLDEKGLAVQHVSCAVQAETPRLAPFIESMKESLSKALNLPPSCIGVTAGTNEKLGYVGEGKGITAYAYVLLKEEE